MNKIIIKLLNMEILEGLFEFEMENKDFFNRIGLGRPGNYYTYFGFKDILEELIGEQEKASVKMYVVYVDGVIAGRVNFIDVELSDGISAELGYRFGEKWIGKGIGSRSVRIAIETLKSEYKKVRLTAGTSKDNISSQRVLLKNNFEEVRRSIEGIEYELFINA